MMMKPSPERRSAADHVESALEVICGALVTLESVSESANRGPVDAKGVQRLTSQAIESLRQAIAELRLALDAGTATLVPGFVLQSGAE
jgi:hypothetical protein